MAAPTTTPTPITVAAFRRALPAGTLIDVENLRRPEANGRREVLPKTNTVDLVMSHPDAPRGSHLPWPKKGGVMLDGDTFVLIDGGEPWLRVTPVRAVLSCDMDRECADTVTHIDDKGWVYCTPHGERRKASKACRRMTTAEVARLKSGKTIWYDPDRNLA